MKVSAKRYWEIQKTAYDVAFALRLLLYPVDVLLHISHIQNCIAIPYSKQCEALFHNDREAFLAGLCSSDAYTDYLLSKDRYIIYYNDGYIQPWQRERMRWTLAHELGHVLLGHHIIHPASNLRRFAMEEETLQYIDKEADIFAAELVAPLPLLYAMEQREKYVPSGDIARHFGLTRTAALVARKRLDQKKQYMDCYRIHPEKAMPCYRKFADLLEPLLYATAPVVLE